MHYVYLLQSESFSDQRYVGMASDVQRRLSDHNAGKSPHTSTFLPWKLVTYIACSRTNSAHSSAI
ncbi:putative endonuclease [Bradyrhizobium sp. AZCC 1588]|uniref:GIY-YIG nuclease family protein n=1 Tax=Bradyrhizobium sp. AZCC 1588 TaxID=3117018 RepID=UPI00304915C6